MRIDEKETQYNIYSIYYDIFNTPLNIDIKKIFEENISPNIQNKSIFLIRFLKQENILSKLYVNIVKENEICGRQLTYPGVIWNYGKMDMLFDTIRISNDWYKIRENNKVIIDNIILITSEYINIIDEIKNNKNIFLITNSKMTNSYNTKNVNIINYDAYIMDETEYSEKVKKYDKHNWRDGQGNFLINRDVLCKLNMFAKALNNKDLDYTCLRYCHDIVNIEWTERNENIEQYVLYFDCVENNNVTLIGDVNPSL